MEEKQTKKNSNSITINYKKIIKHISVFLIFAFATFLFLLKSPSHIWVNSEPFTDSNVFRTVAFEMKDGAVPYKDTFDHKGPLTYFINYIAFIINPQNGIFYIELITIFFIFVFLYTIARLKCNSFFSVAASFIAFAPLFTFFEGGNFTEEFALPFILLSLFIFLDYFLNAKISRLRLILCGLSLGAVLMLRPNLIALWIVFCIAVLIKCIVNKKASDLKNFIINFVVGLLIIILPFIIWLGVKGALSDFWNAYIKFNLTYTSETTLDATIKEAKINSFFAFYNSTLFIIATLVLIYDLKARKSSIDIYCLTFLFLDFILASMSGYTYGHYGITLIASIVYPISLMFGLCEELEKKNKSNEIISLIVLIYLLATIVVPDWLALMQASPHMVNKDKQEIITSDEAFAIRDVVQRNSSKDDKISVFGNWDFIYLYTQRHHATKYSYQFPIGEVNSDIFDEYFDQLKKELPKIIVIQYTRLSNRMDAFLAQNNYSLIYQSSSSLNNSHLVYALDE